MAKLSPPESVRQDLYNGIMARVTNPSLVAYLPAAIQSALQVFGRMTLVVSSKPGRGRPRLKRILTPPNAKFGTAIGEKGEIAGFGKRALWETIQNLLSRIKPMRTLTRAA